MDALQQKLIEAALPNVVFDGWNMQTLRNAASTLGMPELEADRAFPDGILQALNGWMQRSNETLKATLSRDYNLASMKIRDRIALAVMVKLRQHQGHKDAVRKALALYQLPWHSADGLKALYNTCDTIWRAAGDTSTDWNFYSKRMLLAKVYLTTLYVWLADESDEQQETEAFLRRRIDDVMQIQKLKSRAAAGMDKLYGLARRT